MTKSIQQQQQSLENTNTMKKLPLILLLMGLMSASIGQTLFQGTKILDKTSQSVPELDQSFNDYEVYEFDIANFSEHVHQRDFDNKLRLEFGNQFQWDILLFENDIRSEDFVQSIWTENGSYSFM